jgi:NADPH2:quinone reductase
MQAIVVSEQGGPDALVATEVPHPVPEPGEVVVRVDYAGVNFVDTYKRRGLYPVEVPFIPGEEGSGEVAAVGEGVVELAVGDRVAWSGVTGAYAELAAIPSDRVLAVPEGVSSDVAAAVLLQGMTAHYLVHDTYPLQAGDRCLIHAGAGGVGRLLIQMAKQAGAEVFTTVGSDEKVDIARAAGADHVIDYQQVDFRPAVEAIAGSRPLTVVYDGVGGTTFDDGLALLKRRGMMVLFGGASGPVPPVDPLRLMRAGSLYLTRPTMGDHIAGRDDLVRRADAVFTAVAAGNLAVLIGARYPLADAADAHRALESRKTVGKILLTTG